MMESSNEESDSIGSRSTRPRAWDQGIDLAVYVFRLVSTHASLDRLGLGGRMLEAVTAVPAEIAAADGAEPERWRSTRLEHAANEVAAFEGHLELLRRLDLVSDLRLEVLDFKAKELARSIRALRRRVDGRSRRAS